MILIVKSGGPETVPHWAECFAACAPNLDVRWWDDPAVPPEAVHYALVWDPQPGRLAAFPNLRLVCSAAAGVDRIVADPHYPAHVPLVRMQTEDQAQRMGEYVCLAALSLLRGMPRIIGAQAERRWSHFDVGPTARDTRAGVMGMGNLGTRAATMLRDLGFPTAGWSLGRKDVPGIESFAGPDEMAAFLARTDMLVCLLPDTPATRGLLNADSFARLPRGAHVVNAGRGTHLRLPDLIAALDAGHIAGAMLDVFDPEPLPADHPAWAHPKIIVTPHIASFGSRLERAQQVARAIAALEAGEALPGLYRPERGY
jgi:glyoxylate/hydroxypyruvate reductase A